MQGTYIDTKYDEFNSEYVPSHPTLSWKKIILDFLKEVAYPALVFIFLLYATGKNRTINEMDLKWLGEYILLCTFYCNIFRFLSLLVYVFSLPLLFINAILTLIQAVPVTIFRFIKMFFYLLLTIIRIIRLLYFNYQIKNM